jgi:hypothetical protein
MEIYADNINTLTINNLEIDQSLTLSENITANNATITPTNISYCDATSSIQTKINNLSQQLYTTTGCGFYELLFVTIFSITSEKPIILSYSLKNLLSKNSYD